MSPSKYKQPDQRPIVSRLAAEFKLSVADVTALYECECATLAIDARVTKFLHIFAIRHVHKALQKRSIESVAPLNVSRALPPTAPTIQSTCLATSAKPSHMTAVNAFSVADKLRLP